MKRIFFLACLISSLFVSQVHALTGTCVTTKTNILTLTQTSQWYTDSIACDDLSVPSDAVITGVSFAFSFLSQGSTLTNGAYEVQISHSGAFTRHAGIEAVNLQGQVGVGSGALPFTDKFDGLPVTTTFTTAARIFRSGGVVVDVIPLVDLNEITLIVDWEIDSQTQPPITPPSPRVIEPGFIDHGNFTTDTRSGLDWLDVTESINRPYEYVTSQFGPGGKYEGWRYATLEELTQLIRNYSGDNTLSITNKVVMPEGSIDGLIQLLGSTLDIHGIEQLGQTYDAYLGFAEGGGIDEVVGILSDTHPLGTHWIGYLSNDDRSASGEDTVDGQYTHINEVASSFPTDPTRFDGLSMSGIKVGSFLVRNTGTLPLPPPPPVVDSNGFVKHAEFTTDTNSGLDWLNLTVTGQTTRKGMSHHLQPGGLYDGWRFATASELHQLLENYTGENFAETTGYVYWQSDLKELVDFLGGSIEFSAAGRNIRGWLSDEHASLNDYYRVGTITDVYNGGDRTRTGSYMHEDGYYYAASFLVRDTNLSAPALAPQYIPIWKQTTAAANYHGNDYYEAISEGKGSALWLFTPSLTGNYEVCAWWPMDSAQNSQANYIISYSAGMAQIIEDQSVNGGQWDCLGTYSFEEGNGYSIQLINGSSGNTVADAIEVRYVP